MLKIHVKSGSLTRILRFNFQFKIMVYRLTVGGYNDSATISDLKSDFGPCLSLKIIQARKERLRIRVSFNKKKNYKNLIRNIKNEKIPAQIEKSGSKTRR